LAAEPACGHAGSAVRFYWSGSRREAARRRWRWPDAAPRLHGHADGHYCGGIQEPVDPAPELENSWQLEG